VDSFLGAYVGMLGVGKRRAFWGVVELRSFFELLGEEGVCGRYTREEEEEEGEGY